MINKKWVEHNKKGDVFKAAGWRGPARYTRGNIFADNQNYFQWTGPNYMR